MSIHDRIDRIVKTILGTLTGALIVILFASFAAEAAVSASERIGQFWRGNPVNKFRCESMIERRPKLCKEWCE